MVDNALYVTLSRQTALMREMAVVANNVANANTPGFKSQLSLYSAHPTKGGRPHSGEGEKIDFTKDIATPTNFTEGAFEKTDNSLDVAIRGKGFFMIETPLGMRYSRAGNFSINGKGELVNSSGYRVMGQDGQPISFQDEDKEPMIREDGTISVRVPQQAEMDDRGTIGVFTFPNNHLLEPAGDSLYAAPLKGAQAREEDFRMAQGMLEKSNVESIKEMSDMIEVSRATSLLAKFSTDVNDMQRNAIKTIAKQ